MRAVRLHELGPPEHLVLDELPDLSAATYPLAEAARAHADLEGRRVLANVVLTTGTPDREESGR